MADVEVIGTRDFLVLATRLKNLGNDGKVLRRELRSELKDAAKPMTDAVIRHLDDYLPSGYVPAMATGLRVTPSQSLRGATAGLRLTGKAKGNPRARHVRTIDRGALRHPVYGNREVWVNQRVKPGFWSEPMLASSPEVRDQIREAISKAIKKVGL